MESGRVDRLQWWWHLSQAQERAGEALVSGLRQEAVHRFRQHIERWLVNSGRRLTGGDPFPHLEAVSPVGDAAAASEPESAAETSQVERVREYARMAVGR